MAKQDDSTWGREIQSELAIFPVPVRANPTEITEVYFPPNLSDDLDLQQSLVPISLDPSTFTRQLESHGRGNEDYGDPAEYGTSKASSPNKWSKDKSMTIEGTRNHHGKIDPLTGSSKSVHCDRCGKLISPTPSSAKIKFSPEKKKNVIVCRNNCKNWKGRRRY